MMAFFQTLSIALTLSFASPGEDDVRALAEKVQEHYNQLSDFQAEFTQRYERKLLRKTVEESGTVAVKKPGRMRWEYEVPEEKLFVTDGNRSYFYIPAEKQVMVSHHPQGAMGMAEGSPFELLAGKARLTDSFAVFPSDSPPERGGVMLHLMPLKPREEYEDVELEVRPTDGQILRVILVDAQGNRTEFSFDNVRENISLPESLFRFTVPEGVEVVIQSDARPDRP